MNMFLLLFLTFLEIGAVSFGGGYGMIALMREKTLGYGWLTEEQFLNIIAVSESTPGPIAVNIATFVGATQGGLLGALCATLGVILPSFIIILAIAVFFRQLRENPSVERIFHGIRPAVAALIAAPVFRMARTAKINMRNAWIPVVVALCIWKIGFSPVYIILIAALGGYTYGQLIK